MLSINKNLTIISQSHYLGMPLCISKEYPDMIKEHLDRCLYVMYLAKGDYREVSMFRIDIHFPKYFDREYMSHSNEVMSDFVDNLKDTVKIWEEERRRFGTRIHRNRIRYVWVREQAPDNDRWHYHMMLLMNRDAYNCFGWNGDPNKNSLAAVIEASWAKALGIHEWDVKGLVYFPENCEYIIDSYPESFCEAFYRISYLCKAGTKIYGQGAHVFGSSRG